MIYSRRISCTLLCLTTALLLNLPIIAAAQIWICAGEKQPLPFPGWHFEYAKIDFNEGIWLGRWGGSCVDFQAKPYTGRTSLNFSDVPGSEEECRGEFRYAMMTEDTSILEARYRNSGYFMPYSPFLTEHVVEFASEDALYVRFYIINSTGERSEIQVIKREYGTIKGRYKKFGQERYATNMHCSLQDN